MRRWCGFPTAGASYYTHKFFFMYLFHLCLSSNSLIDVAFGFTTTPKKTENDWRPVDIIPVHVKNK